jgi:adenylate kinase
MAAIIISGTPGTGKTTVSKIVADKLESDLVAVNDLVDEKNLYNGYEENKGYKLVDLDAISQEIILILKNSPDKHVIVEGHLAHLFENNDLVELVIILRARPDILKKRLSKRDWANSKVQENLEAEALDICTFEAVEIHGEKVNELDTSHFDEEEVANLVIEVLNREKKFPPGNLDFLEYLWG